MVSQNSGQETGSTLDFITLPRVALFSVLLATAIGAYFGMQSESHMVVSDDQYPGLDARTR